MSRTKDIQQDFSQLQREYRNMEQNRRAYTEESQNIIRKQQMTIEKLRNENEGLKAELAMESRHATAKITTSHSSQLAMLQDSGDLFTKQIAVEQRNIVELDKQINLMKQRVLQQRKNMGGVNAARDNMRMIRKQIRILENRLDKALIKFNEALAHNKQLRETIDNLRRERVVFDNIYRKLEKELHEKKKQMANIIELSNQAYEARDAAQMEIAAIQQADSKEQVEFEEQMADLGRMIEADKKRTDFMMKEASATAGMAGVAAAGLNAASGGGKGRGDMTMEEESALKAKVTKGVWGIAKDKANIQASIDKVQSYEEAFNKIKAATGISDINELVNTFIANEDQNFSLFNYVNEQNNEMEKLDESILGLRQEEAKYTQESGEDVNQHKQLLNDLAQRLQSTEATAERYELRYAEAQKTINSLKVGIQSMFSKLDCSTSVMSEMLADSLVTDANMMQYLGMIEQRTNDILQMFAAYQRRNGESGGGAGMNMVAAAAAGAGSAHDTSLPGGMTTPQALVNILGQGPMTPMGQELLQINPPNLDDYSSEEESDDDDSEARPLTHQELKAKTMKVIHRRAQAGGKGGKRGNKQGRR